MRQESSNGFTGVVLVAKGSDISFEKAYGAERGVAMRPDSKFWIASAGKQFVSAAILKCRDKGWLTLDDQISRFFPDAPSEKRTITIRQLLSHTSGFDQVYVTESTTSRDEAIKKILAVPLIDSPGDKFHYANNNYELAAAIVEIVSGETYRKFVKENLFRPAGMTRTGFSSDAGAATVVPAREETPARLAEAHWTEAGVYSTAGDLWRWYRALNAGHILSPQSYRLLFAPVASISEGQSALGWFIGKNDAELRYVFTRGNEDWGPNSAIYAYPDTQTVIIVLTHANMATDDLSWSRRVQREVEALVFPAKPRL
jgi:CubicO group peptidase (beta-lactamase class C family)